MHQAYMKYQCEECEFATDFVANLWEHTLNQHPEKCSRFDEIKTEPTIIKFVAEQNQGIIEEMETLKKDTKGAFEQLAGAVDDSLTSIKDETKEDLVNC